MILCVKILDNSCYGLNISDVSGNQVLYDLLSLLNVFFKHIW